MTSLSPVSKTYVGILRISALLLIFAVGVAHISYAASSFPSFGIIHNSLVPANQTIMLGINPRGNLNTANNAGISATNSANQLYLSDGRTKINGVNQGSVGISYFWQGAQKKDSNGNFTSVASATL